MYSDTCFKKAQTFSCIRHQNNLVPTFSHMINICFALLICFPYKGQPFLYYCPELVREFRPRQFASCHCIFTKLIIGESQLHGTWEIYNMRKRGFNGKCCECVMNLNYSVSRICVYFTLHMCVQVLSCRLITEHMISIATA